MVAAITSSSAIQRTGARSMSAAMAARSLACTVIKLVVSGAIGAWPACAGLDLTLFQ
jgi:hypothetical protein